MQANDANVVQQVTIKSNKTGTKTVIDFISTDRETGAIKLTEAKSSSTAPLTKNQKVAHPEIQQEGGTVVGKGKDPFVEGTQISPTKVEIIRPNNGNNRNK